MNNQKGFDSWIPIFRGGKQKCSKGIEHDGNALIDKAITKFNAATHEPPACIGHPADNAPAYGWVKGLKKQGDLLLAKFKQVQPEFAQMVEKGLFKKRSAAFYPDGTLRHVGFLGAMPPAVKGLPDVAFAEGDAVSFEFADYETVWAWQNIARLFGRIRDYLIEKEGVEKADQIIGEYNIEEITAAAEKEKQEVAGENNNQLITQYNEKEDKDMKFKEQLAAFWNEFMAKIPDEPAYAGQSALAAVTGGQFSEVDIEKAKNEAAAREREKVTAEFNERAKASRLSALRGEIAAFCEQMVKAGKITPATVKYGLSDMLFAVAEREDVIEFGETKEKATLYDRFKALIESAQPLIKFGELATRDKEAGGKGNAGKKLSALTRTKMEGNQKLTYSTAFAEVQLENPDLAKEYMAEFQSNA